MSIGCDMALSLQIPPRNPLNTYRLIIWCFLGMLAVREFYEYCSNPQVHHQFTNYRVSRCQSFPVTYAFWYKYCAG